MGGIKRPGEPGADEVGLVESTSQGTSKRLRQSPPTSPCTGAQPAGVCPICRCLLVQKCERVALARLPPPAPRSLACSSCLHHRSRVRQATSAGARGCKSRRACSASAAAAACTTSTASHTGCSSGTCARSMRARHAACRNTEGTRHAASVVSPASDCEFRLGPPPRGPGGPDRPAPRCSHCGFGPAGAQSGLTLRA